MSISVEAELVEALQPEATVLIRVRSGAPADQLAAALQAAVAELVALATRDGSGGDPLNSGWGGPKFVSAAVPVLDGVLAMLDAGDTPHPVLLQLPQLVTAQLRKAGVADAALGCPELIGDRYATAWALGPAARAWLRGPLRQPLGSAARRAPQELVACVVDWLDAVSGVEPLQAVVLSAELPVALDDLPRVVAAVMGAGYPAAAVGGDFVTSTVAAVLSGGQRATTPVGALTAVGPGPAATVEAMSGQRELIRSCPGELVWAGVHAVPDARLMLSPQWQPVSARGSTPAVEQLADVLVPDAHWYQLLSAGHLERLGSPPAGAVELGDGLVELTLGEPRQWLPDHPDRVELVRLGRWLLAGCLAEPQEVARLTDDRMRRARQG